MKTKTIYKLIGMVNNANSTNKISITMCEALVELEKERKRKEQKKVTATPTGRIITARPCEFITTEVYFPSTGCRATVESIEKLIDKQKNEIKQLKEENEKLRHITITVR